MILSDGHLTVSWPDDVPHVPEDEFRAVAQSMINIYSQYWLHDHPKDKSIGHRITFSIPDGILDVDFVVRMEPVH